MAGSVFEFELKTLTGEPYPLAALAGRPLLIVNTASRCGFTPQYAGLQALWTKLGDQPNGLVIIGVPSNDFGNQEPGEATAIGEFCDRNYGVTFPLMAKAHVKGREAHPLFKWLGDQGGFLSRPRWNFYKYLTRRDGTLQTWFPSTTTPGSSKLVGAVEDAL
ncbi:glutathione peroxidase [Acidisoma sp.]|uniref:glutathione peroxidase n=1 Tax=Acidisoma sp. TaxID=1872115 RepID=UPI003B008E18